MCSNLINLHKTLSTQLFCLLFRINSNNRNVLLTRLMKSNQIISSYKSLIKSTHKSSYGKMDTYGKKRDTQEDDEVDNIYVIIRPLQNSIDDRTMMTQKHKLILPRKEYSLFTSAQNPFTTHCVPRPGSLSVSCHLLFRIFASVRCVTQFLM